MKALVKHSPKEGIWMEDVPDPKCGPGEVRISNYPYCNLWDG